VQAAGGGDEAAPSLIGANFIFNHGYFKHTGSNFRHRYIMPFQVGHERMTFDRTNDFPPSLREISRRSAQEGASGRMVGKGQSKRDGITSMDNAAMIGGRCLLQ
jgi:hypothetical protein